MQFDLSPRLIHPAAVTLRFSSVLTTSGYFNMVHQVLLTLISVPSEIKISNVLIMLALCVGGMQCSFFQEFIYEQSLFLCWCKNADLVININTLKLK